MNVYEIDELDTVGVSIGLNEHERRALAAVKDRLGVDWRADGSARVFARGSVGDVSLSEETVIRVTTKVPIANLLGLASLAYRTAPIPTALGAALLTRDVEAHDWFSVLLISEIAALSVSGLRNGYVLVTDELPYIRGRLVTDAAARWARPGLTACQFIDFLPDTPENRVLRATLESLATRRLLPGLKPEVEQLLHRFTNVSWVRPSPHLLAACRVTRLNKHYEPALELCRLYLDQVAVQQRSGGVAAPAFFFPMEVVFEHAITNLLRQRLRAVRAQYGRTYPSLGGEPPHSVTFAADIVIGEPPALVIDTKYANAEIKNRFGGLSLRNANIYQAVFYGVSLRCPVVLVYPKATHHIDLTFDIEGTSLTVLSADLAAAGLSGLEPLVDRLASIVGCEATAP